MYACSLHVNDKFNIPFCRYEDDEISLFHLDLRERFVIDKSVQYEKQNAHDNILTKLSYKIDKNIVNREKILESYNYVLDLDDDFIVNENSVLTSLDILMRIMNDKKNISVPNITISERGLVSLNWEVDKFNLFTITVTSSVLSKCVLSYKPFLRTKSFSFFNFSSIDDLFKNVNFSVILKIMKKSKL